MSNVTQHVRNRLKGSLNRFALLSFRISLATYDFANKIYTPALTSEPLSRGRRRHPTITDSDSAPRDLKETTGSNSVVSRRPPTSFLPIIFLHKSNSDYLPYSLGQAKSSNPHSTVYLLGDQTNAVYDFAQHYHMRDYFEGARRFAEIYRHYSTIGADLELIWFQRWFVLRDFLHAHNLQECLYLDSDVMLYTDVTEDRKKFAQFDFTLCWHTIGCVVFLNRVEGLDAFCQFVTDIFSKKDRYHYDKMVSHYAVRQKNQLPGGACDMTALQLYNQANFGLVGEAANVIGGSFYDPNMNAPHPGFEMSDGLKKVIWRDQQPYGRYLRTGDEVRFNSMHFQGEETKRWMRVYYTGDRSLIDCATDQ
jgi:hypothetical protein